MMRAWQMVPVIAVAWALQVGAATAQEDTPKLDPTGTWKWERSFGDTTMDFTLRLERKDDKLTGRLLTKRGEEDLPPAELEDVNLDGDKLSFAITREFNNQGFTIDYAGKVTEAAIDGMATIDFGGNTREFEWRARRGLDWEDVLGTWDLTFRTPNGNTIETTLKLEKEQDDVAGTLTSERFGERKLEEIAIKEGHLTFAVTAERNGNEFTLNYKVQPRGDDLKGTVQLGTDDNARSFAFSGRRAAGAGE